MIPNNKIVGQRSACCLFQARLLCFEQRKEAMKNSCSSCCKQATDNSSERNMLCIFLLYESMLHHWSLFLVEQAMAW